MTNLKVIRLSDGKKFPCEMTDMGTTAPPRPENNIPRRAYTSQFRIMTNPPIDLCHQINADVADAEDKVGHRRLTEDIGFLLSHGFEMDFDSIK